MLLSDADLTKALANGTVGVAPIEPGQIQPSSIDLRLGSTFRHVVRPQGTFIDPETLQEHQTELQEVPAGEYFMLQPQQLVLGCTMERLALSDSIAGILEGKSSLGRIGLFMHTNAGLIDPGFEGQVTLNLLNVAHLPIRLRPGMRIGQLCLLRLTSAADRPYGAAGLGSHYQGQTGPTAGRGERR